MTQLHALGKEHCWFQPGVLLLSTTPSTVCFAASQITSGRMGKILWHSMNHLASQGPRENFSFLVVWAFPEEGRLQGPTSEPPHCWSVCLSWQPCYGWVPPLTHKPRPGGFSSCSREGWQTCTCIWRAVLPKFRSTGPQAVWERCTYIHPDTDFSSYPRLEETGDWSIDGLVRITTFSIQSQGKSTRKGGTWEWGLQVGITDHQFQKSTDQ